jgi:peroxiredoxin
LGRHYYELKDRNFEVLLILGDTVEKALRYCQSLHLPFPVLADPNRGVYQQYGLQKSFFIQRTASIVIDCDGIIRYIKTATNPMIWMQETLEVLEFTSSMKSTC